MPKSKKITAGLALLFLLMTSLAFYFVGTPGPLSAILMGIPLGLFASYLGQTLVGGWDDKRK